MGTLRKRRAVLKALRDPQVLALLERARRDDPDLDALYDAAGLNVAAPEGLDKLRWLFGADLRRTP